MFDFIRIACGVNPVVVGDPEKNARDLCRLMDEAAEKNADLLLFPELCLTGYTCQDLFLQSALLSGAQKGLETVAAHSAQHPDLTTVLGLPMELDGRLYNCACVVAAGAVRGIVPKTYLPNYNEYYEKRWFSSGRDLTLRQTPQGIPCGTDLMFSFADGTRFAIEICEDLWAPLPPSTLLSLGGAEILLNLSASDELVGKRAYRRDLVKHQSAACSCVYAYASAGRTESTQDLAFSGHSILAENGTVIGENEAPFQTDYLLLRDCDLGLIRADRRKNTSFADNGRTMGAMTEFRTVSLPGCPKSDGSLLNLPKLPFVPSGRGDREARCMEIFGIQAAGLMHRLETVGAKAVIGVSGGLDSTLALLVAVEAMKRLGRPASEVHGLTLPCFGTSDRTYRNALALMHVLGVTAREIPIGEAVKLHFRDIGQPEDKFDATYENSQARERTQILMDYAGVVGGLVVGTGDLSELALGWCTYNADQMSMYGVNASIPKTLVRWMIAAIAETPRFSAAKAVLLDILDTPISPELLPPDAEGKISQYTEDLVGPYALHDFFLYYCLRVGFAPKKIYALACQAFAGDFLPETISKWLKTFYRRFFTQQFKRSCMPDGIKVGSVALSPRGDWRMPSDASAELWLSELETL